MKIQNLLLVFISLFAFVLTTNAQTERAVVTKQVKQNARIYEGVRLGELTRSETRELKQQQRDINRTKRAAKADGKVTVREKAVIRHKQKQANANITRKKNNQRGW